MNGIGLYLKNLGLSVNRAADEGELPTQTLRDAVNRDGIDRVTIRILISLTKVRVPILNDIFIADTLKMLLRYQKMVEDTENSIRTLKTEIENIGDFELYAYSFFNDTTMRDLWYYQYVSINDSNQDLKEHVDFDEEKHETIKCEKLTAKKYLDILKKQIE